MAKKKKARKKAKGKKKKVVRSGKTIKNLRYALKDETEATNFYPRAAKIARKEGCTAIAKFFSQAAKDERKHRAEIKKLLKCC